VFCLTISTGPSGLAVVPDVVAQLWLDAESALTSLGLEVLYMYEPSLTVDPDHVINQSPPGEAEVSAVSVVKVIVSLGPDGSGNRGTDKLVFTVSHKEKGVIKGAHLPHRGYIFVLICDVDRL
jgi:beta-lactam-binding protein with PASTA domain